MRTTFVFTTSVQRGPSKQTASDGMMSWTTMAMVSKGMARLRAALTGATVRAHIEQRATECSIEAAQAPREAAMQEARDVQEAMAAWRSRNDKAQATAKLSATMPMAIVRRRRVWQMHTFWQAMAQQRCRNKSLMDCCLRQMRRMQHAPDRVQAANRLHATMQRTLVRKALWETTARYKHGQQWRLHRKAQQHWCLAHMLHAWHVMQLQGVNKAKVQQARDACKRIKASMAMVAEMQRAQLRKTCCKAAYLRLAATYAMVEVKRVVTSLVQQEEKLRAVQDVKNRREAAAARPETRSMVQQLLSKTRAVERDVSVLQATLRASNAKRMVASMVSNRTQSASRLQALVAPTIARRTVRHSLGAQRRDIDKQHLALLQKQQHIERTSPAQEAAGTGRLRGLANRATRAATVKY